MTFSPTHCAWLFVFLAHTTSTQAAIDESTLPTSMILLTVSDRPPSNLQLVNQQGITAVSLNLSRPSEIKAWLEKDLPHDSDRAMQQLAEQARAITAMDLMTFIHPALLIYRWDLKQVPALVFNDGEAVVYGVTNFSEALSHWYAAGITPRSTDAKADEN